MLCGAEQVNVRNFDKAGMAMATTAESRGGGCGITYALHVSKCQGFVGRFADYCIQ
jgi:hypothetical protein